MNITGFDLWARALLSIDAFAACDDSLNGVQVGRSSSPLASVAFAVDGCMETIRRARELGAQALFVHHGLFWGKPVPLTGTLLARTAELIQSDMALYACHLPLDAHPEYGNNAVLANMLGMIDRQPFGEYHGKFIGFKGRFPSPRTLEEATRLVLPQGDRALAVYPFGKKENSTVAVVSGGAPFEAFTAVAQGIDLYITGESSHSVYHEALEGGLNMISAGHYATEVHGLKAVAELASRELGLETMFIEYPTGQ